MQLTAITLMLHSIFDWLVEVATFLDTLRLDRGADDGVEI